MRLSRLLIGLGFAAGLALMAGAARADGNQADIISQHGDALSRASSAPALAAPMPSVPPNSAPPKVPSAEPESPSASEAAKSNDAALNIVSSPAISPSHALGAPATVTGGNSAPPIAATPAAPESGKGRAVLIVIGALIALAMFLWERRSKD